MEKRASDAVEKRKKTLNACQWCRARKIKCTGQQPCHYCVSKGLECLFKERSRKVFITEQYLQELQRRSSELGVLPEHSVHNASASGSRSLQDTSTSPQPINRSHSEQQAHHTFPVNSNRQRETVGERTGIQNESADSPNAIGDEYRRIGHSSSFSFSRHIRKMITESVRGPEIHDVVPIKDGAYGMPWRRVTVDLNGLNLPSEDYAEYLTHTVLFSLRPLYYLFDKDVFLTRLRQFYADRKRGTEQGTGLWHIQMLVIFALGTSILAREAGPTGPTGTSYFSRAIEALPDCHQLSQEPVISIEILCLFALFMQAMDMRLAAYQYIGIATRISIAHGLDRRWDSQRNTREEFKHRSKLWWTVYVIDRKLSSLLGVIPGLLDEDISLPKPKINENDGEDWAMAFHVEIMAQLGHILNVVYGHGPQRELGGKFITAIQSVLQKLALTSRQLNMTMKNKSISPSDGSSRSAATLYLLHHQCSILAVRPIVYFLLKKRLSRPRPPLQLSDAVLGLLRLCIESSLQILNIIESLREHKLLDAIVPHDIDVMFAATFILIVVDIIVPTASQPWDLKKPLTLLDTYTDRGIIIAGPYKKDLTEIIRLRETLKNRDRHTGDLQTHTEASDVGHVGSNLLSSRLETMDDVQAGNSPKVTNNWDLELIHPETIQSAIEGLEFDPANDLSAEGIDEYNWMW